MFRAAVVAVAVGCVGVATTANPLNTDASPDGTGRVLGTTVLRPGSPAVGMAVLPGGRLVAVSTLVGVSVWDLATGRRVGEVAPPTSPRDPGVRLPASVRADAIGRISAAPDGKSLVYLKDGAALRLELPLGDRQPIRLPFPGGTREGFVALAGVGAEGTLVAVSNLGSVQSLPAAARRWVSFATDPDAGNGTRPEACVAAGTDVFAAAAGNRVRLGRADAKRTAGVALTATFDTEPVRAVAVSRDDRRVAVVGRVGFGPPTVVRVCDAVTGERVGKWEVSEGGFEVVALSPDGSQFAAAGWPGHGQVTLFDAADGAVVKTLPAFADRLRFLAYLPDGSGLVGAGLGGVVHHWRLPGGEPAHPVRGHHGPVRAVAARPGGGAVTGGADGFVVVYDRDGREERRFEAHAVGYAVNRDTGVGALALSRDGAVLYTAGAPITDSTVRAWKLATGEKVAEFVPPGPANTAVALAVAADGRAVAAALRRGGVRLLDPDTLAVRASAGGDAMTSFGVGFLTGERVAALDMSNRSVGVWEAGTGKEVRRVALPKAPPPVGRPPLAPAFDPWAIGPPALFATSSDGTRFAAAVPSSDGVGLRVWTAEGVEARQLDLGDSRATAVAFASDAKLLAVGGADGSVRLFDLASGAVRHTFTGHRGAVMCLVLSPDGRHLVSGGSDTTARVWALPQP